MTLKSYVQVLRERWVLITAAVGLGLALAVLYAVLRPPVYTAQLQMYVSAQFADDPRTAYQGAQLSEQRVKSYTELLTGVRVSSEVQRRLGLDESPEEVARMTTATSELDSVILEVAVSDTSAGRATQIANTIGEVFPDVVTDIERPADPGALPPVVVRVIEPADVPAEPSSIGLPAILALGLLGGLAGGALGAVAVDSADTSVRTPETLRDLIQAPTLGSIPFDRTAPRAPLVAHDDPQSPRAEAHRQLRTHLQYVDVDRPPQIMVITSAGAREGKTTTVLNLAQVTASTGRRVLVVDADLRRPQVADLLGLEGAVGLTGLLTKRLPVIEATQRCAQGNFDVITSGALPPNPSELLGSQHMAELLDTLRGEYDMILIDAPPLLPVTDAAAVSRHADGAIIICRAGTTSAAQVRSAAESLRTASDRVLGGILTMVPTRGPRAPGYYMTHYHDESPAPTEGSSQPSISRHSRPFL